MFLCSGRLVREVLCILDIAYEVSDEPWMSAVHKERACRCIPARRRTTLPWRWLPLRLRRRPLVARTVALRRMARWRDKRCSLRVRPSAGRPKPGSTRDVMRYRRYVTELCGGEFRVPLLEDENTRVCAYTGAPLVLFSTCWRPMGKANLLSR